MERDKNENQSMWVRKALEGKLPEVDNSPFAKGFEESVSSPAPRTEFKNPLEPALNKLRTSQLIGSGWAEEQRRRLALVLDKKETKKK